MIHKIFGNKRRVVMLPLFLITITLGSALLFLVQPMCARFVLPLLGGTPAVWTTCMLFFQAGLLVGYAYTHFLPRWIGNRAHALLHMALLFLGLWFLPLAIPTENVPPAWPAWWLLGTLTAVIGLPYVLIAANAPLLQRWFALGKGERDPYFLYAASNLGSFGGLLAYPFLLEPLLTLAQQAELWRWGYVPLAALTTLCGLPLLFQPQQATIVSKEAESETRPDRSQKIRWVLLALVPSSTMLSVTSYLTADIAPLPLFWVIPLSLYLLTFVLAFSGGDWFPQRIFVRSSPVAVVAVVLMLLREANEPVAVVLGIHLFVFTLLALQCHGELARTRPTSNHLTGFYLWLSVGGVLGGILNGLVAPLLFPGYLEYPLMLVLAMHLRPRAHQLSANRVPLPWQSVSKADLVFVALVGLGTLSLVLAGRWLELDPDGIGLAILFVPPLLLSYLYHEFPVRFGLAVGAILLASIWQPNDMGPIIFQQRSFFGVHRVMEKDDRRYLFHGNTIHGSQELLPSRRLEPLTYYTKKGPAGQFFKNLENDSRLDDVGLVGLGTGTLAIYARPGQRWSFFEIDPLVAQIAEDSALFTFLAESRRTGADVSISLGDARLTLRTHPRQLGVLVLDAFGSDSIPTHLLTKEAFLEYQARLREDGYLLMNISNRYLELEPVLANLARELSWTCMIWDDTNTTDKEMSQGKTASIWALLMRDDTQRLQATKGGRWRRAVPRPDLPVWRDDYANILPLIRW